MIYTKINNKEYYSVDELYFDYPELFQKVCNGYAIVTKGGCISVETPTPLLHTIEAPSFKSTPNIQRIPLSNDFYENTKNELNKSLRAANHCSFIMRKIQQFKES